MDTEVAADVEDSFVAGVILGNIRVLRYGGW